MSPSPTPDPVARMLDDFVGPFEEALGRAGKADLAAFLPDGSHPLYHKILRELVRVDLEHGWESGWPSPLDDYRQRFPELFADASHLQEIAFEEYRQRRRAGQAPSPAEYEHAYGVDTRGWPSPVGQASSLPAEAVSFRVEAAAHAWREFRLFHGGADLDSWLASQPASAAGVFGDLHRVDPFAADRLADGLVKMPEVGTEFLGFRLISELGRGAFGRVFLARQAALANRLVALKVSPDAGGESQKLAQLHHTHIVPVYSLHRADPLQAVCMPFVGTLTLADVLRDLYARPALPQSGVELLSTLNVRHAQASTVRPADSDPSGGAGAARPSGTVEPIAVQGAPQATLKKLEEFRSYVNAVVWLGSCLADGLAHAHERGILHRDLKPANVLLTDEGQPMLLDFNLSEDVKARGASAALIGGTLPYMAPEHLEAFGGGRREVDERSDIFSLGIILYELLAGRPPFPGSGGAMRPGEVDRAVAHMAEERRRTPDPARRWNRDVSPAVDAILRRCLEPEPARRYPSARQLQEDLECQLQSLPLRHTPEPSLRERVRKRFRRSPRLLPRLVAGAALLLVAVASVFAVVSRAEKEAEQARRERLDRERDAAAALERAKKEILEIKFLLNNRRERAKGEVRGRALLADYGATGGDGWREHELFVHLGADEQRWLAGELGDVLFLMARARDRSAEDGAGPRRQFREEALALAERAAGCFDEDEVPPAVGRLRARLFDRLGRAEDAARSRGAAERRAPETARDYCLDALEALVDRRYHDALPLLRQATRLDPTAFWAWLLLGFCYDGLNDTTAALASYHACIALAPDFHGSYFNRGLVYFKQRKYAEAAADFGRAIALGGGSADAYANRGLVHSRLNRPADAVADLTRALEIDSTATHFYFVRQRARPAHDPRREEDFAEGMKRKPTDVRGWNALGSAHLALGRQFTLSGLFPAACALAAFEQGLADDPDHLPTLKSKSSVLAERFGSHREALAVQDTIVRLYPDHAEGVVARAVLHARLGDRDAALGDARKALLLSREAMIVYQAGDAYALTSRQRPEDAGQALTYLHEALRNGFGADVLDHDPDLRPLHGLPEFRDLQELAARLRKAPRRG